MLSRARFAVRSDLWLGNRHVPNGINIKYYGHGPPETEAFVSGFLKSEVVGSFTAPSGFRGGERIGDAL
jgi:hypothetical protein